ncbi:hypothetical protein BD626DRAFT_541034 [Schizophyllum amplum]|uniref:Uncharacterized protein n=1 Tax=Schizophyllum amplum TaxID=97359 RepID=A0A550BW20_9AGAR|nr:hypothetical protein BD626DRAFT_541034 [Auriculariopsis ampla]
MYTSKSNKKFPLRAPPPRPPRKVLATFAGKPAASATARAASIQTPRPTPARIPGKATPVRATIAAPAPTPTHALEEEEPEADPPRASSPETVPDETDAIDSEGPLSGRKRGIDAVIEALDIMREKGAKRPHISDVTCPLHPYLHASRMLPRVVPIILIYTLESIVQVGMAAAGYEFEEEHDWPVAEPDEEPKSEMLEAYRQILAFIPGFAKSLTGMSQHNIKALIHEQIISGLQFAMQLVPHAYFSALRNKETRDETMEQLQNGSLPVANDSLPMLLWDPVLYDEDDDEAGMMMSPVLVCLYRGIILGPSHAWKPVKTLPKRFNALAHGQMRVNAQTIALASLAHTSSIGPSKMVTGTCKNIKEFEDLDEEEILTSLRRTFTGGGICDQVFSDPEGLAHHQPKADSSEVSMELTYSRARRAARKEACAAKRAADEEAGESD